MRGGEMRRLREVPGLIGIIVPLALSARTDLASERRFATAIIPSSSLDRSDGLFLPTRLRAAWICEANRTRTVRINRWKAFPVRVARAHSEDRVERVPRPDRRSSGTARRMALNHEETDTKYKRAYKYGLFCVNGTHAAA